MRFAIGFAAGVAAAWAALAVWQRTPPFPDLDASEVPDIEGPLSPGDRVMLDDEVEGIRHGELIKVLNEYQAVVIWDHAPSAIIVYPPALEREAER